jgi:RNAse (barnase) inhibitor barstar
MTRRASLPHHSGVYAAPGDTSTLRARAVGERDDHDVWRTLDLSTVRHKSGLLHALSQALDFPGSFGHNWDALADALQDLSWLQWSRLVIEIDGVASLRRHAPDAWRTALDIFRDAATYWATHDRTFVVLVHGETDLAAPGA